MQVFTVGGAVRDELLGFKVQDRDYVVVGATPAEMLAAGYRPVGKDFPVFLHPKTHEEYALARTERKSGHGYHGFAFDAAREVTLEEDLARRDLTINAIARADDGTLTDPFRGVADLAARVLRHVGPAFIEDPVRILRVARFGARFFDFSVAPETVALMREMVDSGEIDHLVAERVWQEFARGLMEARPSRMLAVLEDCGALARLLPEIKRSDEVGSALDIAALRGHALAVRFAVLLREFPAKAPPIEAAPQDAPQESDVARQVKRVNAACARLKAPADCRDLALLLARHGKDVVRAAQLSAAGITKLLETTDALRRPQRFKHLLEASACQADGADRSGAVAGILMRALAAARAVDAATIARTCSDGAQIAERVQAARAAAVEAALQLPE